MARITSVEHSTYISEQMEIFSQNRIGQYSKFLDKNFIPVTYYHMSEVYSLKDVGTGNVSDIVGHNSPIRYNKILNFPVYNLPELKPNIDYDPSTGFDIEMDISDIAILPSTIKPQVNDLMLVELPNSVAVLFRVNNIRYNTIQSNDFYMVDCDVYKIGDPKDVQTKVTIEEKVDKQVVGTFYTVFDNIGTDDKCFIRHEDVDKIKQLAALILDLRNIYKENYYNRDVNAFIYGQAADCQIDVPYYYDMYLAKFIADSGVFYDEYADETIVLVNQVMLPQNFDKMFRRTLFNAVLSKSSKYLDPYIYMWRMNLTKRYSAFDVYGIDAESPSLVSTGKVQEPNLPQIEDGAVVPYSNCALCNDIKTGEYHECNDYTLYEALIYNYISGNTLTIDHVEISDEAIEDNFNNYMMVPMIIYILMKSYDGYFRKLDEDLVQ